MFFETKVFDTNDDIFFCEVSAIDKAAILNRDLQEYDIDSHPIKKVVDFKWGDSLTLCAAYAPGHEIVDGKRFYNTPVMVTPTWSMLLKPEDFLHMEMRIEKSRCTQSDGTKVVLHHCKPHSIRTKERFAMLTADGILVRFNCDQ